MSFMGKWMTMSTEMFTTRLMSMRMPMKMMITILVMMGDLSQDAEKYLVCSWKMSHWRSVVRRNSKRLQNSKDPVFSSF